MPQIRCHQVAWHSGIDTSDANVSTTDAGNMMTMVFMSRSYILDTLLSQI